jgi:hypothetical protein
VRAAALGDCYMDAIKHAAGATVPKQKLSATFERKFAKLLCELARDNAGMVPNVDDPNASPRMVELREMMATVTDIATLSELMKRAMAACTN